LQFTLVNPARSNGRTTIREQTDVLFEESCTDVLAQAGSCPKFLCEQIHQRLVKPFLDQVRHRGDAVIGFVGIAANQRIPSQRVRSIVSNPLLINCWIKIPQAISRPIHHRLGCCGKRSKETIIRAAVHPSFAHVTDDPVVAAILERCERRVSQRWLIARRTATGLKQHEQEVFQTGAQDAAKSVAKPVQGECRITPMTTLWRLTIHEQRLTSAVGGASLQDVLAQPDLPHRTPQIRR